VKSKHRHLIFLSVFAASLASRQIEAAPVLNGVVFSGTAIYWTWTGTNSGSTLTLETSTGGLVAQFAGTTADFVDSGLSASTLIQRKLYDSVSNSTSPLVTMATPDNSVAVAVGFPGTLVASDNVTRVALAQGALPGNGQASVSLDPVNKPLTTTSATLLATANANIASGLIPVPGSVREFTAISNGNPYSSTFAAAVTIQMSYTDADNNGLVDGITPPVPVKTLAIYTIDPASQRWTAVPSSVVDSTNKVLTASVSHFSIYALFGVNASATLADLKVFPSPWRPGSGGTFDDAQGVHFRNLTPTATISIYTVTGHIVRRIEKQTSDGAEVIWDGRNTDGDKVASGVYLYLVTAPNLDKQTGRFAIIR